MPSGKFKSNTFRKIFRVTPGHKNVVHHEKRKPSKAKCANCGAILKGVPREKASKMQNMPKTQKRPERPFGGVLCSKCSRVKVKEEINS